MEKDDQVKFRYSTLVRSIHTFSRPLSLPPSPTGSAPSVVGGPSYDQVSSCSLSPLPSFDRRASPLDHNLRFTLLFPQGDSPVTRITRPRVRLTPRIIPFQSQTRPTPPSEYPLRTEPQSTEFPRSSPIWTVPYFCRRYTSPPGLVVTIILGLLMFLVDLPSSYTLQSRTPHPPEGGFTPSPLPSLRSVSGTPTLTTGTILPRRRRDGFHGVKFVIVYDDIFVPLLPPRHILPPTSSPGDQCLFLV